MWLFLGGVVTGLLVETIVIVIIAAILIAHADMVLDGD